MATPARGRRAALRPAPVAARAVLSRFREHAMRIFARFVRAYPRDSLAIVLAMVTSGALEGISYTALIPVAILFFSGDAASAIPGRPGPAAS